MMDFSALYCQDKQCMTFSTSFPQKRISLLENLYAAEYTITNSALTDPTTVEMNRRSKSAMNSKRKTGEYQMWHMILAILNFSGSLCLHFRILKPTTFLQDFKPTTFKLDTHLQSISSSVNCGVYPSYGLAPRTPSGTSEARI